MPRKKIEESPDDRITRLRKDMAPEQYVKRLHADLTAIVNEIFFIDEKLDSALNGYDMPNSIIPTEHLTIVGFQFFNDEGDRGGDVRLIVRDGSMPAWFARGLIGQANERVTRQLWQQSDAEIGGDESAD